MLLQYISPVKIQLEVKDFEKFNFKKNQPFYFNVFSSTFYVNQSMKH